MATTDIGTKVTARIGGETHVFTIGDQIVLDGTVVAVRSTDPADHHWTHLWVNVECLGSRRSSRNRGL